MTGIGPGTFELYWNQHAPVPEFLRDAHSLYLEVLAENGILGLLAILVALGGGLVLAIRVRSRLQRSADVAAAVAMIAAAIVFVVQAGADWFWEETALSAFGLAAIGIVLGGRRGGSPVAPYLAGADRRGRRRRARRRDPGARPDLDRPGAGGERRAGGGPDGRGPRARERGDRRRALVVERLPPACRRAGRRRRPPCGPGRCPRGDRARPRVLATLVRARPDQPPAGDRAEAARAFDELARLSLPSAVPYATFEEFARDPVIKAWTREGCLALSIGACANVDAAAAVLSRCVEPPALALAAIESFRGAALGPARAVKGPVAGEPVYFVASALEGETAIWALTPQTYRTGAGQTIPLNDARALDPRSRGAGGWRGDSG